MINRLQSLQTRLFQGLQTRHVDHFSGLFWRPLTVPVPILGSQVPSCESTHLRGHGSGGTVPKGVANVRQTSWKKEHSPPTL